MFEQNELPSSIPDIFPPGYHASLLTSLIHKLNNIITVLLGHSGLLEMETGLSGDALQSIQQMSKAIQTLSRYIDEAAIVSKAPSLTLEAVTLQEVLKQTNLVTSQDLPRTGIKAKADRRKLQEICEQICQNAQEAGAKQISVKVDENSDFVDLRFRDNGPGIKPLVLSRAFDPFYTTKKDPKNFGLGLFKVQGDLARMNGKIMISSDGLSFTEVVIRLPRASVPEIS